MVLIFKIATYNMLKGGTKRVHWKRMLLEHDVDLLLAQESFAQNQHLPQLEFSQLAGRSIWNAAGNNKWGSAVCSKSGQLKRVAIRGYKGWVTGVRITDADWQPEGTSTLVVSVHAPNGPGSYRGQVNKILDRIARVAKGDDVIVGGDFNISISTSAASDRPVHKGNLAVQLRLQEEFGLINCWQAANTDQPIPQTLRWTGDRTIPYHCDGIFVPAHWQERLCSCEVLSGPEWDALSDHNPVIAEFDSVES
jgi:exonuclease III